MERDFIFFMDDLAKKCLSYCLRILSMRGYSEFRLREKLREKGYPTQIATDTIEEMKRFGYIKEDFYRQSKIKMRLRQGKAARFIRQELQQEKIVVSENHIEEALYELNDSEDNILTELLLKKTRNIELADLDYEQRQKLERKVISSLIRHGHDFGKVKKKLDSIIRESKEAKANN